MDKVVGTVITLTVARAYCINNNKVYIVKKYDKIGQTIIKTDIVKKVEDFLNNIFKKN